MTLHPTKADKYSWTGDLRSNEYLFRRARRHSRVVRILRIVLPAFVVLTGTTITLETYLSPLLSPPPANLKRSVVSGTKITMDRPHMVGFTRDGRPYEFKAETATQDLTKPNLIELQNIKSRMETQDHGTMRLTAPRGLYDSKDRTLSLQQRILITSTNGFQGRLKDAKVNMKTGEVISNRPVKMKMIRGTIKANRFEIINSGDLIRFDHGVHMTVRLNESELADTTVERTRAKKNSDTERTRLPGVADTPAQTAPRNAPIIMLRLPESDPRRTHLSAQQPMKSSSPRLRPLDLRYGQ